ncbi:MAG: ABC transporter substrate-binding protein, partial [candidate division NC10 bacterium]
MKSKLTRRQMLQVSAVAGAGALAAACGGAPAPTAAPKVEAPKAAEPTKAPEATAVPEATKAPEVPAAPVGDVPRNRSLILNHGGTGGKYTWVGITNEWAPGFNHQEGGALLNEPLFYFSVFADKEVPWLAEGGTYNADYTELTIKMHKGTEWSDGTPLTSKDVKFTLDTYASNEKTVYHAQCKEFIKAVTTPDDQTVVITMNTPNPRFKFEVLSEKFDTGIPIFPAHFFEGVADVTSVKGEDKMPHSGMFKLSVQTPEQMIYDIRPDWWGFKTGFQKAPDIQRVIIIPLSDMATAAQRVVNNECDACLDLRPALIRTAVQSNPKIITHTGKDEPLGYIDWWPNSLWMNTQLEPYSNPDVRWAINHVIDRDTIDKVVFMGAKITSIFPYPEYPALKKYLDLARPLGDQMGVREFSLEKSAALMEKSGFTKDGEGMWVGKDGKRVNATIHGFESIHADIVPVLTYDNGGGSQQCVPVAAWTDEASFDSFMGGITSMFPYPGTGFYLIPGHGLNPDAVPGRANRFLARRVDVIFAQYRSTIERFPAGLAGKVRPVGCPVRAELLNGSREQAMAFFGLDGARRTLVINGGSQGATTINEAALLLEDELAPLASSWQVLHITGKGWSAPSAQARTGGVSVRRVEYCDRMDFAYAAADLLLGRAGASTTAELAATGTPAVLLPYPYHKDQHQRLNAQSMIDMADPGLSPPAVICEDVKDARLNAQALRGVLLPLLAAPEALAQPLHLPPADLPQ